ncbi:MAG: response regulator [Desulfobulbaceae bacterium]|nr:response regulator [Desulfobulbaceae bacterium]
MLNETIKILIVDDRPENLHAMQVTLASLGIEILTASSGNEALALMLRHEFALVLLDVQMPGMDGFETATLMQGNQATRDVPIIFVTAINKDQRHVFKGYETGAVDYLFKPLDADILLSKVKVFIKLHQAKLDAARIHQELLKTRNLESLGFLAGGIAHDFNNILAAIMGNIDLCLMKISPDDETYPLLEAVNKATSRATKLTQQLLTFARGGNPVMTIASISEVITASADFVLRGSKAACHYDFPSDLWSVEMDTGQISQVIQNLVINAIQAMPEGGIIDIRCQNVPNSDGTNTTLPPTDCVTVTIHDTGQGIPESLMNKIFDPYFTTKETGSGLGLALCHSIITKHGGKIMGVSKPEQGTSFMIALPAAKGKAEALDKSTAERILSTPKRTGRIMVMDDDEQIREMTKKMLSLFGYEVLLVKDGDEALSLYEKQQKAGRPVDLVIMDLTIPGGMGGKETMAKLRQITPSAKAIVASGYANDPIMAAYRDYGFLAGIHKPFQLTELRDIIDKTLQLHP